MGLQPARRTTRDEYERRILAVQRHLEAHLDEELEPGELAAVAGLSVHHFHRVFSGLTGESVMGHIRRLRLERAARQLRTTKRKVLDIAVDAGYESHEGFSRAFREAFGQSPSSHRRQPKRQLAVGGCRPVEPASGVELRRLATGRAIALRHIGPYEDLGPVWEALVAWFEANRSDLGAPPAWEPPRYGISHDDPQTTPPQRLRYDACLGLPGLRSAGAGARLPAGPVSLTALPGGLHAVLVHHGSYASMANAYLALLGGWFPDSGHVPAAAAATEHYLVAADQLPGGAADEQLVTELLVPIEERGWMT